MKHIVNTRSLRTMARRFIPAMLASCLLVAGCMPNVKLFPDATDPLKECLLQGSGPEKIAIININGAITDKTKTDFMSREHPSLLQEVVARLERARQDPAVKALVLKINSPGGSITASDILYNRLLEYKQATNAVIVVSMMDVAASGGYYVSLPADRIMAHPTTVTGSVGVIFVSPRVERLMDKIGLGVSVRTSGRNKDMGSPLRGATAEEETIFNDMISHMGNRFLRLVEKHRQPDPDTLKTIATARIFSADAALEAGLIDRIGYLEESLEEARTLAGLPVNAAVVTYRKRQYANDTIYNTLASRAGSGRDLSLINIELLNTLPTLETGFYYLWWPAVATDE